MAVIKVVTSLTTPWPAAVEMWSTALTETCDSPVADATPISRVRTSPRLASADSAQRRLGDPDSLEEALQALKDRGSKYGVMTY